MLEARQKALRFTSLKLQNWRNFRSLDVALGPRAFIVGPNASGKSNLLDAFRFVSEVASGGAGGLQAAIERRGGFTALRSLYARNPSPIEFDIRIGFENGQDA